ncbi:MAG: hypothetical protein KatS3mg051_2080 [Anaerolineae bacterium]|nr:MAG: hypothetical protein KatS3mg051_2080 [Anaerolineae bacterium]
MRATPPCWYSGCSTIGTRDAFRDHTYVGKNRSPTGRAPPRRHPPPAPRDARPRARPRRQPRDAELQNRGRCGGVEKAPRLQVGDVRNPSASREGVRTRPKRPRNAAQRGKEHSGGRSDRRSLWRRCKTGAGSGQRRRLSSTRTRRHEAGISRFQAGEAQVIHLRVARRHALLVERYFVYVLGPVCNVQLRHAWPGPDTTDVMAQYQRKT